MPLPAPLVLNDEEFPPLPLLLPVTPPLLLLDDVPPPSPVSGDPPPPKFPGLLLPQAKATPAPSVRTVQAMVVRMCRHALPARFPSHGNPTQIAPSPCLPPVSRGSRQAALDEAGPRPQYFVR